MKNMHLYNKAPRLKSYFVLQETNAKGEPIGEPHVIDYAGAFRILAIHCHTISLASLQWYVDIACSSPGQPVDMVRVRSERVEWSARLLYHVERLEEN